jgi:uncharacterized membrane protein
MSDHTAKRYPRLDALRGLAVFWMVGFHFCYDLNHFRFTSQNFFTDPFWTVQRTAIVSLFLFCAGLGQAVAQTQNQSWSRFWKRWAQVVACALLVSVGSWLVFGPRFISFGVLHGVAVMLLVQRVLAHVWPGLAQGKALWMLLVAGGLCIVLPLVWQHPVFDSRWTYWLGFATGKPATEDYVPLLPWLGVLLWGFMAGAWLMQHRAMWLQGAWPEVLKPLAWLGRCSLSIYMLHQPLLFAMLTTIVWWLR